MSTASGSAASGGHVGIGPALVAQKVALTSVSAMLAELSTLPVDVVKTRLQLQGAPGRSAKVGRHPEGGFLRGIAAIVRAEGVGGLYTGAAPAVARHIPYTGLRTIGYEHLRQHLGGSGGAEPPGFVAKAASGITAGSVAQTVAVPFDVVKVRMMGDRQLVSAGQLERPRYTGLMHAFRTIAATEGLVGMYAGCGPAIQRAALVNLGELTTYDTAKGYFVGVLGDTLVCHVSAATCSGFFAALCSTPADVAKSRIMNQARAGCDQADLYRGTLDCWARTVRNEGPLALWKGFLPGWMRLGPWQLVFWCSYEHLRIATGIGGFK